MEHKETRWHPWENYVATPLSHTLPTSQHHHGAGCTSLRGIFSQAKKIVFIDNNEHKYRLRNAGSIDQKFQTGAYLWWPYSIENCGSFISTKQQKRCYKELQIRTLLQLVREARTLDNNQLASVIKEIQSRQKTWQLASLRTLIKTNLSAKALIHLMKFKFALINLNRRLL